MALDAEPAFGFHFGAWEGVWRNRLDGDAEVEGGLEGVLEGGGKVGGGVGTGFNFQFKFGQGVGRGEGDSVFGDFWEFAEDFFDGAGEDVDPADNGHVVSAAKDAAFEGEFGSSARANFFG